jgi:ribosome-binding ATPase YchF (GTP1/OBG family)|tara:strand:+ start:443 stop:778 length:336 start_codon:yes stop_codon:yes gene_type:complete
MAIHDITIQQGADFAKTLTIKDDSDAVINVSSDTFRGQVRKLHSSTDIQATFTFDSATNGASGIVAWTLTAAQTAAMGNGKFVYDVEWVKSSGSVVRLLEGVADTTPEVTR